MTAHDAAELDELRRAWRALQRRLERQHALELAAFRRGRLRDVRSALRPTALGQLVQAGLGALLVVWFAAFWAEQRHVPQLFWMGVLGQLWSVGLVAFAVRDLVTLSRVDYTAPVVEIQKHIAELRARRVRVAPFYLVTGCFMWIPVAIVFFRGFGAELWPEERALAAWFAWAEQPEALAWLLANALLVPLLATAALRWARSARRPRLARRIDEELAGRSVLRAEAMLAEIAEFEREESAAGTGGPSRIMDA